MRAEPALIPQLAEEDTAVNADTTVQILKKKRELGSSEEGP